MHCGVMVTGYNQGDWERLLGEDYSRPPAVSDAANMDDTLYLGELVEPLGFDSIWATEHYGSAYSMQPNPLQYLAYWAGRTSRVDVGTAVIVAPWWNPVRLASEISMLDILLKGRRLHLGIALERARMVIASTIASAAMGADIVSSRIIRELARERAGAPEATLWFDGGSALPVADAARVNAVMSDTAASDDSDLRSIAHIGTIVSTTAIAMAERTGASGRDVLAAMVLGYEIAGRIDEALTPGRGERGFHGSISTIFGGAVAAGTLLELTPAQMTQAIALAATSIGGLMVAANTSVAREYHAGLSAMLGIHAALAAHKGFVAEENVLEMPRGFFSCYGGDHLEDVTKDLGTSWDITTDMAIKLVPGGHPHHAAAEAATNAAIAGDVDPHDVASIVLSSAKYRTLPGPKHPTDLIGVAHSPAYFIAAAIADRGYGWIHASAEKVTDPVIARLIDKITVDPNPPPYPDRFAHHHGATVTITLKDGRRFSDHVDFPRGSAPRGIEWADVDAKYRRLVPLSRLTPEKVEASLDVVHGFDAVKTVSELTRLLH